MHLFRYLRNISFILCISLLVFGCAANKSITNDYSTFYISAEQASNGIILNFNNIPENTILLSVSIVDITNNDQGFYQVQFWDNEAFGFIQPMNELADLRQTQTLLAPFARNGHEYAISVFLYADINLENWTDYSTSAIAGGGIFMTNNPSIYFTDENTNLRLSELPIFSEEVEFSDNIGPLAYSVMFKLDDENTPSSSQNWNDLIYPINTLLTGAQKHFGFSGVFPVIGSVQGNVLHKNVEWVVSIANTEEVIMTF